MNRIYYMSVMQKSHGSEVFLSEEMQKISATKIRAKMREDGKLK